MATVAGNHDPDAPDGITVRVSVETTDYWALGYWLAQQGSDDQAEFLRGMQTGFQEMGAVQAGKQFAYISTASDLSDLARLMHEHLGDDDE